MYKPELMELTYESEMALIGAILIQSTDGTRDCITKTMKHISPNDFIDEILQQIFKAMSCCNNPPHILNVAAKLNDMGIYKSEHLKEMGIAISLCPCSLDYEDYARLVRNYREQRYDDYTGVGRNYSDQRNEGNNPNKREYHGFEV